MICRDYHGNSYKIPDHQVEYFYYLLDKLISGYIDLPEIPDFNSEFGSLKIEDNNENY